MTMFIESRKDPDENFIRPGFGMVRANIGKLWTVVGSSVAVTLFDRERSFGGMTHYTRPYRTSPKNSTPFFAAPAIVWLVRQFLDGGSRREDMEAQLIGGAFDTEQPCYEPGLNDRNVAVGLELLAKQKIWVSSMDVGGNRGRKIVFNPKTGESAIARVSSIRSVDWYPPVLEAGPSSS